MDYGNLFLTRKIGESFVIFDADNIPIASVMLCDNSRSNRCAKLSIKADKNFTVLREEVIGKYLGSHNSKVENEKN